jgi:GT2 family glycosyltransferase/glycosyltransferase involved in cell wall biosynthesis
VPDRFPDLLCIGQEDWDEVERRNQLLVLALARRNAGMRVLFTELPLRPRSLVRLRRIRPREVARNVFSIRTVRPLPDRSAAAARLNDRLEARQLRRALRTLGIERPLLWTQDPRAASLVDLLELDGVLYDLTDDWAAFEQNPARRTAAEARITALGRRARLVLACSRPLEEQARTWNVPLAYVPNAVEPAGLPETEPSELMKLPRPRLGYAGTLHDARLDVELLAEAAQLRPDASFVLLGPDLLREESRATLRALPNVHFLGVRPRPRVRAYLEALDVCLVPHRVDDFTRSLDPLKLYEYLAAGRPVVSTPTGNAPELAEHVKVAATAAELVAAAEQAIAEDDPAAAERRRLAVAGATWEARAEQVEEALGTESSTQHASAPDVSAVVISFGTRELLGRSLEALESQADVTLETIVVDNGSTDGSPELVRECFPRVKLLELGENTGYARANNLGIDAARGRAVLLLNSDCFLARGALAELVSALERHPEAAAVGPRLLNPDGTLQRSAWPFPRPARLLLEALLLHRPLRRLGLLEDLRTWGHDEERPVDFLVGACLLVRAEALAEVGGFDETFWFYGEEADLCRRLARRGWQVVLAPEARAVHIGGASARSATARLRLFYGGQNRFLRKHAGRSGAVIGRLALVVGSLLRGRFRVAGVALGRGSW